MSFKRCMFVSVIKNIGNMSNKYKYEENNTILDDAVTQLEFRHLENIVEDLMNDKTTWKHLYPYFKHRVIGNELSLTGVCCEAKVSFDRLADGTMKFNDFEIYKIK